MFIRVYVVLLCQHINSLSFVKIVFHIHKAQEAKTTRTYTRSMTILTSSSAQQYNSRYLNRQKLDLLRSDQPYIKQCQDYILNRYRFRSLSHQI